MKKITKKQLAEMREWFTEHPEHLDAAVAYGLKKTKYRIATIYWDSKAVEKFNSSCLHPPSK